MSSRPPSIFLRALLVAATGLLLSACGTLNGTAPSTPAIAPPVAVEAAPVLPASAPAAASPTRTAPKGRPVQPAARAVPDAVPKVERISGGHPNVAYEIRGIAYEPVNFDMPMREVGLASWYGADFHGKPAATGERFDMDGMTAAHPTMPLPSFARVRNLENGRQVVVRVNDRGPFFGGRIIDLSRAAARKLGIGGVARVEVERLTHDDIRTGAWKVPAPTMARD